jgi:hypothetical protein
VAVLSFGDFYDAQFVKLHTIFMVQLQTILPPGTDVSKAYASGSDEDQVRHLFSFMSDVQVEFGTSASSGTL